MGWQDRDWAKWTDEERARFLGSTASKAPGLRRRTPSRSSVVAPGAFLAAAVSLVATVALSGSLGIPLLHRAHTPAPPLPLIQNIYGIGTVEVGADGRSETCTQMLSDGACTGFTFVAPGQRALAAAPLPPGTTCPVLQADQAEGAWVCAAPPAPPTAPSANS